MTNTTKTKRCPVCKGTGKIQRVAEESVGGKVTRRYHYDAECRHCTGAPAQTMVDLPVPPVLPAVLVGK